MIRLAHLGLWVVVWQYWKQESGILPCRYLENVPSIVPLLEKEYRIAAKRLEDTQEELNDLHPDK